MSVFLLLTEPAGDANNRDSGRCCGVGDLAAPMKLPSVPVKLLTSLAKLAPVAMLDGTLSDAKVEEAMPGGSA